MDYLNTFLNLITLFSVGILLWDKVRASRLRAELDGKRIVVPQDEVKEAFRRAALAEATRLVGSHKKRIEREWQGTVLVMTTTDENPRFSSED